MKNKHAAQLGKLSAQARRKKAGSKKAFSEHMKAIRRKGIKTKVDKNQEISPIV